VSPSRSSFLRPLALRSATHRFLTSVFSSDYKSLVSQPHCFHIYTNPWGVGPVALNPGFLCLRVSVPPWQTPSFYGLGDSFSLLPLFSEIVPFVFKSLQPLFAKCRGWGIRHSSLKAPGVGASAPTPRILRLCVIFCLYLRKREDRCLCSV
jgi:hypothetical protein